MCKQSDDYIFHHELHTTLWIHYNLSTIAVLTQSWSSLVKGDKGCLGPSGRLLYLWNTPNTAHAWQHSILLDFWYDPVVHLLIPKSSMTQSIHTALLLAQFSHTVLILDAFRQEIKVFPALGKVNKVDHLSLISIITKWNGLSGGLYKLLLPTNKIFYNHLKVSLNHWMVAYEWMVGIISS